MLACRELLGKFTTLFRPRHLSIIGIKRILTSKATGMSRPTCPTRSFETQQLYRVERRSVGGERKVEVVRERMYVGGLNPEVTGELLVEVFSQFGLVRTITWF